jgi:hypothetical protein
MLRRLDRALVVGPTAQVARHDIVGRARAGLICFRVSHTLTRAVTLTLISFVHSRVLMARLQEPRLLGSSGLRPPPRMEVSSADAVALCIGISEPCTPPSATTGTLHHRI